MASYLSNKFPIVLFSRLDEDAPCGETSFRWATNFFFFLFYSKLFISILLDSVRQRRDEGEESYKLSRPLTIIRKKMIPVK